MERPGSPRLFLIDGYALIYRAFFALITRPLTNSRGENTSAVWGIANFLQRLKKNHNPEYIGWVHDSGLSFRHERYPEYKATREKLTDELQADFDTGMERICQLLEGYRIPIMSLAGYEADDVIGTLVKQSVRKKLNVVVVSGDKDFQQLVRPGVWLLNPGRGGPGAVEENWVSVENGSERLGVSPEHVVDYLALVGDSSDNVPGVKGIGEKTACELVEQYGTLENILKHAGEITKKRPREALLEQKENALLSKELVTIRDDLDVKLDLDAMKIQEPDARKLKDLFVELEFHTLAKSIGASLGGSNSNDGDGEVEKSPGKDKKTEKKYVTIDTIEALDEFIKRAKKASTIAFDTETAIDPGSPALVDPLRCKLISVSIALAPGEAYYFPFAHRVYAPEQGDFLIDVSGDRSPTDAPEDRKKVKRTSKSSEPASIAARMLAERTYPVKNLPPLMSKEMAPLRELLEDPSISKTAQNSKYDILVLRMAGVNVRGLDFDTMLASYVLDPGRRSHGLDMLSLQFLNHTMTSYEDLCGKGKSAMPFDQCPIEAARDYSCEDADMTLQLRTVFEPQLKKYGLTKLFHDVEVPLVCVLAEMEATGISIDIPWLSSLKERFQRERKLIEADIYKEAGTQFNIASNNQLREILFVKLGLPVIKKTATGPSTDASVLQELAEEGHKLPTLLMEYRELAKLENTYLDTLPELVNPRTGRIHTSFNQTVASTGRLSSTEPNLQNIPIRRELGRDIRRGFIPRKGWSLLAADYSQIELRLLAHLSHDPAFVKAFNAVDGTGDIHKQTAAIIFDVPLKDVTPTMRARAKTINFATIYGQGPHALSRQLSISHAEAKDFIARYFERFVGVKNYLESMVEFAREHGYVQTIFGRRRYIPEIKDRNFNIRAFGERTAANSPIQGSAADLIKIAMIRIDNSLREGKFESRMLLQVHDELVFEAPKDEMSELQKMVKHEMEHAAELSVPLVVDMGVGKNWLEVKG